MDYKRIYASFIKDRRAKEADLFGYSERHHIVPRSIGGGDERGNLIRLTPEDHFFAHLLLAKIHGGKLWAPIAFMVNGTRKDYKPTLSRVRYGWLSRAMARAVSGSNAYQFDWSVYHLEHESGLRWSGRQSDMPDELGLTRPLANLLIKRRIGSAKGWFHVGERPARVGRGSGGGKSHPAYRSDVYTFLNVDGRKFSGTQFDLHREHGVSRSAACNLVAGNQRCVKGWYVEGKPPIAKTGKGAKYRVLYESRAKHSVV